MVDGGVSVWAHLWATFIADLAPRGAVGVVVDGGVCKSFQCADAATPIFTKFISPSFAINRRETTLNKPTSIGGHTVSPGDIVMGDKDGVIVIPQENEEEFFGLFDQFMEANAQFGKIAGAALAKGTPLTQVSTVVSSRCTRMLPSWFLPRL